MMRNLRLLALLLLMMGGTEAMANEEPRHTVVMQDGELSIRTYAPTLVAEVTVPPSDNWRNDAFRILAGFIFGNNTSKAKVAMTAPVTTREASEKIAMTTPVGIDTAQAYTMRFYMPAAYTSATLPVPNDTRIVIRELPEFTVAVNQFSGLFGDEKFADKREELATWLADKPYRAIGEATCQFYNPPWTLPWWRRNEVWIPVKAAK